MALASGVTSTFAAPARSGPKSAPGASEASNAKMTTKPTRTPTIRDIARAPYEKDIRGLPICVQLVQAIGRATFQIIHHAPPRAGAGGHAMSSGGGLRGLGFDTLERRARNRVSSGRCGPDSRS